LTDRAELLAQIKAKGIVHGEVTLSSGHRANWYIDLRRVLLDSAAAPLAGRVMLDLTEQLNFSAVGGLTLGADPVATAMMHAAAGRGQALNAFIVRKETKAHGLQRRIEGPDVTGQRVLAVEDTSTTGNSVLQAVDALAEAGAEVVGVAVVIDRGARAEVERRGYPYLAAFDLADLDLN
jgi:orotate phosphoribosyltransferase